MDPNQNSNPQPVEMPQQTEVPQQSAITSPQPIPQSQPVIPERNRGLEMVIPINRSGWSIAAGYVALFNIPFVIVAPVGIILGIVGLRDISKHAGRAGKGRCWFAIIYGSLTIALIAYVRYASVHN